MKSPHPLLQVVPKRFNRAIQRMEVFIYEGIECSIEISVTEPMGAHLSF